jgi:hypothetical protein
MTTYPQETQTGNPIADELIRLTPHAKDALMQGVDRHIAMTGTLRPGDTSAPPSEGPVQGSIPLQSGAAPAPDTGAIPLPQRQSAPMGMPEGITAPGTIPVSQAAAKPAVAGSIPVPAKFQPPSTPMYDELSRVTKAPLHGDQAHTHADTGRSGIGQIHNPWARIPLQVLDAVGRFATPGLEAALPGTEGYHQGVVADAESAAKSEQGANESVAKQEHEAAQTGHEQAETDALRNPVGKPHDEEFFKAGDGSYIGYRDALGKIHGPNDPNLDPAVKQVLQAGKAKPDAAPKTPFEAWQARPENKDKDPVEFIKAENAAKPATVTEGDKPLGPRVDQINQAMTARYQVLHPGAALPAHYVLPADATQKDFDRTDKLLQGEESAFGTNENRKQTAELRKQTSELAQANRTHKDEQGVKAAAFKAFTPAMDSAERVNVMTKNYDDAVKNHDQQAMLSLLANHLGMTMGLAKGARINQAIISEAEKSRPWLQGMKAKFDKDGYLAGLTLTAPQMKQMVDLGRSRLSEDVVKARSEAKYQGSTDDGPDRVPSQSTMEHYLDMTGNDPAKAKKMLTEDGWTY